MTTTLGTLTVAKYISADNEDVIVSDADQGYLRQWTWHINHDGFVECGAGLMHQLVMRTGNRPVGHINGDPLDNQRSNLRFLED